MNDSEWIKNKKQEPLVATLATTSYYNCPAVIIAFMWKYLNIVYSTMNHQS